jgi:hypothetical protein
VKNMKKILFLITVLTLVFSSFAVAESFQLNEGEEVDFADKVISWESVYDDEYAQTTVELRILNENGRPSTRYLQLGDTTPYSGQPSIEITFSEVDKENQLVTLDITIPEEPIKCEKEADPNVITEMGLATIPDVTSKPIYTKSEISRDEEEGIITYYKARLTYQNGDFIWHLGDNNITMTGCEWSNFEDISARILTAEKETRDDNTYYSVNWYVRGNYQLYFSDVDLETQEYDPNAREIDSAIETLQVGDRPNPQEDIARENLQDGCYGCEVEGVCYEPGSRLEAGVVDDNPRFCSNLFATNLQEPDGSACVENYECLSNSCIDGTCSGERGTWLSLINWLMNLFS